MTTLTDALGAADDLLAVFPPRPTEIRIGYARVSTGGQKLDRQVDALTLAGCRRIFPEQKSGKNDLRPELKACHAFLQSGDTLVVPSLDRYGRSLQDLVNMVAALREGQIGFTSLHEKLDTLTPGGRLIFHVFAALAEFIRELIVQGTNEGPTRPRRRPTHRRQRQAAARRPRHDAQPGEQHRDHRGPPRRLGGHPLQPHPRPQGTADLPRPRPARRGHPVIPHPHRMKGAALVLGPAAGAPFLHRRRGQKSVQDVVF
ncbi:DNA invertase (plasmid) [Streptomyces alboflavus]|uniref:DNA invertase n=1 Tax=Streptomyces alboflavus TaxID=67267 RepID=A0A291W5J8_9ACTN|nr:DNA invertase [Streptomyces alboflavus]